MFKYFFLKIDLHLGIIQHQSSQSLGIRRFHTICKIRKMQMTNRYRGKYLIIKKFNINENCDIENA